MQQHARPKNGNAATRTLVQRVETLSFFRCERAVQICLLAFERLVALPFCVMVCFANMYSIPLQGAEAFDANKGKVATDSEAERLK